MDDLISRQAAIDAIEEVTSGMSVCLTTDEYYGMTRMKGMAIGALIALPSAQQTTCKYWDTESDFCALYRPSAQPEPFVDADKLKRCRFEYINACKTVTYPTPDTCKNDIYDAYAVIKALHPIFGDEEFLKTERKDATADAERRTDEDKNYI